MLLATTTVIFKEGKRVKGVPLTGLAFLAPTLALWTISFLSPSCIPLRPATA